MPDEVDQALTVIYRELENVTALRQDLATLKLEVKTTEQARRILEGRLALERSGHDSVARKDAEIEALKRQVSVLTRSHEALVRENNDLKQGMQSEEKAGLEQMQVLKASLRRLLGK